MALERIILERMHAAMETGDQNQHALYEALHRDLLNRKREGLVDQTEEAALNSQLRKDREQAARSLALKINEGIGSELDDTVQIRRLRNSALPNPETPPKWTSFATSLSRGEKVSLSHAIGMAASRFGHNITLEKLRALPEPYFGELSTVAGIILANSFTKRPPPPISNT